MKRTLMLAVAGSLVLTACGDTAGEGENKAAANAPPEMARPGSWNQKVEVVELSGTNVRPGAKDEMNQMFAAIGAQTVCVTPELAEQQDVPKRLADLASQGGDCSFQRRHIDGRNVDFAAVCKSPAGQSNVEGKGLSGATAQDMTVTITKLKPDGSPEGKMVWHITGERKGECGPNDIHLPPPVAKS